MINLHVFTLALLVVTSGQSAPIVFQSSDHQTSVLELYTSEGCSSCPPAETWFSQLKNAPGLWTDFVPVAFHVDYWNHLGWKDAWSKEEFSDRQRAYAQAWNSKNIYTPEFVLNGKEWSHGFWQKSVPPASDTSLGLLKVSSNDTNHWQITFAPATNQVKIYEVHAVLLVSGISSDVKAGENVGRQLKHDFVAIVFTELPLVSRTNIFKGEFVLDTTQNKSAGRLALAVWITRNGKTEPVQAVGGWLTFP